MATDDERREIAAVLRSEYKKGVSADMFMKTVCDAVDPECRYSPGAVLILLADLIDPPAWEEASPGIVGIYDCDGNRMGSLCPDTGRVQIGGMFFAREAPDADE